MLSAWRIGLMSTSLALPRTKGWFERDYVLRGARSALPASRSLLVGVRGRSGEGPNRSPIPHSRNGKAWRRNVTTLPILWSNS